MSEKEFEQWNKKHTASGLSQTDLFIAMIKNTVIKVYSFDDTIKSLVHELRKIGVNLNQLAYMANSGREYQAVSELREMSKQHNIVMESIKEFLEHPILNASVHNTDGD